MLKVNLEGEKKEFLKYTANLTWPRKYFIKNVGINKHRVALLTSSIWKRALVKYSSRLSLKAGYGVNNSWGNLLNTGLGIRQSLWSDSDLIWSDQIFECFQLYLNIRSDGFRKNENIWYKSDRHLLLDLKKISCFSDLFGGRSEKPDLKYWLNPCKAQNKWDFWNVRKKNCPNYPKTPNGIIQKSILKHANTS